MERSDDDDDAISVLSRRRCLYYLVSIFMISLFRIKGCVFSGQAKTSISICIGFKDAHSWCENKSQLKWLSQQMVRIEENMILYEFRKYLYNN